MILVVDDDLAFFQKAQAVLAHTSESGILFAQDAAQAMKLLGTLSDEFSVALIDLDLPGTNGFDLIDQVRKKYPRLPVIAMSGVFSLPFWRALRQWERPRFCPSRSPGNGNPPWNGFVFTIRESGY